MLDRHRLLVIGQRVGRNPIDQPQRAVQADHQRRHRLITQRHHHPKPAPRQPRAEQHRPHARHLGPVPVVPLQPEPRLRDPRPRPPPVLLTPPPLGGRHRPSRRAIRPRIAHRHQDRVRLIGPHMPARAIDQLIDLPGKRIYQRTAARPHRQPGPPPPGQRPAAPPSCDHRPPTPPWHAASPSRHTPQGSPSLPPLSSRSPSSDRALPSTRPGVPAPQDRTVGRNRGHHWGDSVAAYGELSMATVSGDGGDAVSDLP